MSLNVSLSTGKSTKGWINDGANWLLGSGIRTINEGDRDRLRWERKSRTGPCSHFKSYLDRSVPRACHPSVTLIYNVHLKGGVWEMPADHCPSGWTEKEWNWVCSNLPHSTCQPGPVIHLFTELWASSNIFGSPVLSHTALKDKSAHCLMGNRSTQHLVSSSIGVKCVWFSYHQ